MKNLKYGNISIEKIQECSDSNQLLKYKLEIDGKVAEVKNTLELAEGKAKSEGEYMKPEEYARLKAFKRVLGTLMQAVNFRLREIKGTEKVDYQKLFNYQFVNNAKEVLTEEQFNQIKFKTQESMQELTN